MTTHETSRILSGLSDTGGYKARCFAIASRMFLSGHSLDKAIASARAKYGF